MNERKPYRVSLFGQIALAIAVIAFLFGSTFQPENVGAFYVMLFLLILGIVLSYAMVGVRFIPFDRRSLLSDFLYTMISFVAILIVNTYVKMEIGISPVGETAFSMLAGVSEEWFFRLWLCAWIFKITRSRILAIIVSAFIWALFHVARYGSTPNAMIIVFLCGIPLGWATLDAKSADGPSFGHALVNLFARR